MNVASPCCTRPLAKSPLCTQASQPICDAFKRAAPRCVANSGTGRVVSRPWKSLRTCPSFALPAAASSLTNKTRVETRQSASSSEPRRAHSFRLVRILLQVTYMMVEYLLTKKLNHLACSNHFESPNYISPCIHHTSRSHRHSVLRSPFQVPSDDKGTTADQFSLWIRVSRIASPNKAPR